MLVTRPEPGATETAAELTRRGYLPIVAPLLRIVPLGLAPHGHADILLATSGNAIPHLPAARPDIRLLVVGDRTAARARAAGFHNVESADGDAEALAELVQARCTPGTRLLLATARGQGHHLAAALRAAGYAVQRRAVYAAEPAKSLPDTAMSALVDRRLGAALFLSAETARAFVTLLPQSLHTCLCGIEALAIGAPTAAALAHLPWRGVRVSAKPTLERVLALL